MKKNRDRDKIKTRGRVIRERQKEYIYQSKMMRLIQNFQIKKTL